MKERPILFSGEMVRAILDGRKTQTRRVIHKSISECITDNPENYIYRCPYGQPGDRLWVRETYHPLDNGGAALYRADKQCEVVKWTPSIFMFREYSRINLEITNIRVERLQDIKKKDAEAEGLIKIVEGEFTFWNGVRSPILAYRFLWEKINGSGSWDKNPWVWVVEFRRVS